MDKQLADVDRIQEQVERVLSEPLFWFPVRHHSAAVARHLQATIRQRRPKVVFVEGPAEANDVIPFVVDAKTKPPVAIYSSYRDDDNVLGMAGIASPSADVPARFSCWYPLLTYSPEYVAMQAAAKLGAEVVFIDLPHYALLTPSSQRTSDGDPVLAEPAAADENGGQITGDEPEQTGDLTGNEPDDRRKATRRTLEYEDDRLYVESGFYQKLADVAGYRSWPEAWDSMFESGSTDEDPLEFRRELATFCAAVRATIPPQRVAADGTLQRERYMLTSIRQTLQQRQIDPEDAMVVCGGFHLFLDRSDTTPPPDVPAGTVYTTLVPYSFFRISELSGYAAGNRAPQYYQRCWEMSQTASPDATAAEHIVAILHRARRDGEHVSAADAIAVCQHARMLAQLRGRRSPVLDDLVDAVVTCCCKGNPDDEGQQLLKAIDTVNIGTKVGRVTPKLGRLPMVNDFYTQIDQLQLDEVMGKEKSLTLTLDKREELDLENR